MHLDEGLERARSSVVDGGANGYPIEMTADLVCVDPVLPTDHETHGNHYDDTYLQVLI